MGLTKNEFCSTGRTLLGWKHSGAGDDSEEQSG